MKRLSLILTIFLLGIVLVSCGKTIKKTTSSKSALPVVQERLHGEVEDHGQFVLVKPQKTIPGQGNKGVFVSGRMVELSNYYIGKYEVTYKLWKEVYEWAISNGYTFKNVGQNGHNNDGTEDNPVTHMDWLDSVVWCNAYTEKEKGLEHCVYRTNDSSEAVLKSANNNPSDVYFDQSKKGYRLPTEAEWEYAARLQGEDSTNSTKYGYDNLTNFDSSSGAKDRYSAECQRVAWYNSDKTLAVGQKDPNYAGIYDMSGNVWEWCYDGYNSSIPTGIYQNPVGAVADDRAVRGGSWHSDSTSYPAVCFRNYWKFNFHASYVGFRLSYSQ